MKILSVYLIILICFFLYSCKGDNKNQKESNREIDYSLNLVPIDSLEKEKNIADILILGSQQENFDSLFRKMNLNIKEYFVNNAIEQPSNSNEQYFLYDKVVHLLYDYKNEDYQSNIDIYYYFYISEIENKFLIDYILKQLKSNINEEIYEKLVEENSLIEEFILYQQNFLKTHIDEAYDDGSCSFIKYYSVADKIDSDYLESLKDLYFTLTNSKTSKLNYFPLDNDFFIKEYNHITNDLIPQQVGLDNIYYNRSYNAKRDKKAISDVKESFWKLLSKRNEILRELPHDLYDIWNNSTYRFQKSHLILLKNEFEGLGLTNSDMNNVLLPDSCTYEELLSYPNFSIKWIEYVESI